MSALATFTYVCWNYPRPALHPEQALAR